MSESVSSLLAMVTCTWPTTSSVASISKRCVAAGSGKGGGGGGSGAGGGGATSTGGGGGTGGPSNEQAASNTANPSGNSRRYVFTDRLWQRSSQEQRLVRQLVAWHDRRGGRKVLFQQTRSAIDGRQGTGGMAAGAEFCLNLPT